jgi:hypothetical protein
MRTLEEVRSCVRGEFGEMPGRRLKPEQVQRLCGIEQTICQLVLESLVDAKFLYQTRDGAYARLRGGALFRRRAART